MISVIIPVYNAEQYLRECLDSITLQNYSNFEVLLINDGSSDNSETICQKYADRDKRFKVFKQANSGVAAARNAGLSKAAGKYVFFLDADDWLDPHFFSIMRERANNYDLPICRLIKKVANKSDIVCDLCISSSRIPTNEIIACYRGIYLTSIIREKKLQFESGRQTGEDQEFIYKYMLYCQTFAFIPEAVYYYRINPDSAMFSKTYKHFDAVDALCAAVEYVTVHANTEIAQQYNRDLIQFNALRTMEFAITTLLSAGESPCKILNFMRGKGYFKLMTDIFDAGEHYRSQFILLWKISPMLCLTSYSVRKSLGRMFRKLGMLK